MKIVVTRVPTRPPAGKYPGIIHDWDIEEKTSRGGIPYHAFILSIMVSVQGQLMNVRHAVPLLWNPGDPMYVLCNSFGVLPQLHEDFNGEVLLGKQADVTVRENTHKNRTYSNVDHITPHSEELPKELLSWKEQRESLVASSSSTFDKEDTTDNSLPENQEPSKQEENTPKVIDNQPLRPVNPLRKNKISPAKRPQKIWGTM